MTINDVAIRQATIQLRKLKARNANLHRVAGHKPERRKRRHLRRLTAADRAVKAARNERRKR